MRYGSYEEVEALHSRDLFSLLTFGDAQERVWASWALGLRLDAKLVPILGRRVRRDRAAGTRRHQAMMLAAFGADEDLRHLARDDEDDRVRGAVLAFIARFVSPEDAMTYDFLVQRLLNETPAAQLAIVENLREDAPDFVVAALEQLAEHDDPVVRRETRATRARVDPCYALPRPPLSSPFSTTAYPLLVVS